MNSLRVQVYPVITSAERLSDILARIAWHFSHVPQAKIFVPLGPQLAAPKHILIPEGFALEVQEVLDQYLCHVHFQLNQTHDRAHALLEKADIVLKHIEGDCDIDEAVAASKKVFYKVDPYKVRQEGSFFIQCAFDLNDDKQSLVNKSQQKFIALLQRIGRCSKAWVLATGPSVEAYADHDFRDAAVIVCNSVVLNDTLMDYCNPSILVFADPIFHFGVSKYAGHFREVVKSRLATTNLSIIVPFKYYPLLISKLPEYKDRIIGIPFEKMLTYNLDLRGNFLLKTTANILTLLLLPLAATMARQINLIGCDGRPLEKDNYFWSHGKTVQINAEMENIKRIHPGFFSIDYNEYYFEHCHSLANLLEQGEEAGFRFAHHGPSHIPALRDRRAEYLSEPLMQARLQASQSRIGQAKDCVVIEPDGIGMSGHYVRWHNNLCDVLLNKFERVVVLCNCKQDVSFYSCHARPTFTRHSWSISRADHCFRRDFIQSESFIAFVNELLDGIRSQFNPLPSELSLYVYYGSVQILKAIQIVRSALLREGCSLKSSVCLFHESVILKPGRYEPRFPPNAAEILLESVAQVDSYRVGGVTRKLSDFLFAKFGIATTAFPNPSPGLCDSAMSSLLLKNLGNKSERKADHLSTILLLGNPRDEKGGHIYSELLDYLRHFGVPAGQRFIFRTAPASDRPSIDRVEYLDNDIDDESYWHLLSASDIAILPYLSPAFAYRTSGILADALLSALPVIVLEETWLADVVRRYGSGLVVNYRSPLTLTSAVNALLANYDIVRRRISKGSPAYFAENTWSAAANMCLL